MVREGGCGVGAGLWCRGRAAGPGCEASGQQGRGVLHIRSGPTSDGSAESCGNTPALNAVEILPCAEGPALHMGARALKTNILVRTPESCGKPRIDPRRHPSPMCNTIARPGKDPIRLGRTRSAREGPGMTPTGNQAPPEPRGNHRPAKRRIPRPVTTAPFSLCYAPSPFTAREDGAQ